MTDVLFKDIADYDYCLVFPTNENKDFTDYGKMCMENIQALGYDTYIFRVEGQSKRTYFQYFFGCGHYTTPPSSSSNQNQHQHQNLPMLNNTKADDDFDKFL